MTAALSLENALALDAEDPGASRRGEFHFPRTADGEPVIYLCGNSLGLQPRRAAIIIRKLALAVDYAHEAGILHRDLKPQNILLDKYEEPKITDFGLATNAQENSQLTATGTVLGTPSYMPPEQARGKHEEMGKWSDVYSLGATLFYLLTARVPFDGATPADKLLAHVGTPPPNLLTYRPDAPQPIEAIIHWLMAKRPEDRPQTATQVAAALAPFCPQSSGYLQVPSRPTFEQPVAQPVAATVTWTAPAPMAEALPDSALNFDKLAPVAPSAPPPAELRRVRRPVERPRSRGGLNVAVLAAVGLAVCGFGGLAYVLIDKFAPTPDT